eukprot:m.161906 g.161906  ORF g.161906 m.161906 type:complete len:194 (-) comp15201_c3_seq8:218-799(-)
MEEAALDSCFLQWLIEHRFLHTMLPNLEQEDLSSEEAHMLQKKNIGELVEDLRQTQARLLAVVEERALKEQLVSRIRQAATLTRAVERETEDPHIVTLAGEHMEAETAAAALLQRNHSLRTELCGAEAELARLQEGVRARAAQADVAVENARNRILRHVFVGLATAAGNWHRDPLVSATVLACSAPSIPDHPS